MEFYQTAGGRLGIKSIPPVLAELLRQIPTSGERDSDEIESRFFPEPSDDPDEHDLREDWKAHVEPELHGIFQNARLVVEADLRGMKEDDDTFFIEFSKRHAEAWLNALNQARFALVAQYEILESEMDGPKDGEILNERHLAMFQMNFYGYVLHWLLEVLDEG